MGAPSPFIPSSSPDPLLFLSVFFSAKRMVQEAFCKKCGHQYCELLLERPVKMTIDECGQSPLPVVAVKACCKCLQLTNWTNAPASGKPAGPKLAKPKSTAPAGKVFFFFSKKKCSDSKATPKPAKKQKTEDNSSGESSKAKLKPAKTQKTEDTSSGESSKAKPKPAKTQKTEENNSGQSSKAKPKPAKTQKTEENSSGGSSNPPVAQPTASGRTRNRWGDGIDAPAAGARDFFPVGWIPNRAVKDAIQVFGHSASQLDNLIKKGSSLAAELAQCGMHIPAEHTTAVYAYTEEKKETDLYGKLNLACRTTGTTSKMKLALYRDYLYHLQEAHSTLPNYCGRVYRGINCKIPSSSYADGKTITWQQFSSASKKQHVARNFLGEPIPLQLSGTMFVINVKNGKEIEALSEYPEEEEVLMKPNTFFKVVCKVSDDQKSEFLADLSDYDMTHLTVYHLSQL